MPIQKSTNVLLTILVATLATMAFVTSPASALEFELRSEGCAADPNWGLCWAETETGALLELKGEQSATVLGGENLFNVSELGVEILCAKVKDLGNAKFLQPTPLGTEPNEIVGSLNFEECALEGEGTITKLCIIPTSQVTQELLGEFTSETNMHVGPKTGTVIMEIEFKNKSEAEKCPATVVGKRTVTGSQDLTITTPGHTLSSKSATIIVKSNLLFLEKVAELTGSITFSLTGFEDWFDISGGGREFELGSEGCAADPNWGLCWAETETGALLVLKGEQSATVLGGENLFNVQELGVEILCAKVKDLGNARILQPTPLSTEPNEIVGSLRFEECALEGEGTITKRCVIPSAESTNELIGEFASETSIHLVPKTGTVIMEIEFKNKTEAEKCPATVIGKRKVTGSQDLTITNPEHTLSSKSATTIIKSNLLFIEKSAELTDSLTFSPTGFEDWFDISGGGKAFELGTEECTPSEKWRFCWAEAETSPLLELKAKQDTTILGGENRFTVPELGVEILCAKVKDLANAQILQPAPLGTEPSEIVGSLRFEECALEGEGTITKRCVIPSAETTNELIGELTSETNLHFVPKTGTVIMEIEFKNRTKAEKCPATVIGKRKVTGSQDLTITNPEHTLSSKSATTIIKSNLLFIEKTAELTGSLTFTLTGFEDWFDISKEHESEFFSEFELVTEECTGTKWGLCWAETETGPLLELKGERTAKMVVGESFFNVPELGVEISCNKAKGPGNWRILQPTPLGPEPNKLVGSLEFQGCALEGGSTIAKSCTIPMVDKTPELTAELSSETNLHVVGKTSAVFIEFEFQNKPESEKCPLTIIGRKTVTGYQDLTVVNPRLALSNKSAIMIVKSGLLFSGERPTELTGEATMTLTGFEDWFDIGL